MSAPRRVDRTPAAADHRIRGLSDAQELVARKVGFDGRTALIQGAEPMPFLPTATEPWRARTFIVRDPDGNLLAFAGS